MRYETMVIVTYDDPVRFADELQTALNEGWEMSPELAHQATSSETGGGMGVRDCIVLVREVDEDGPDSAVVAEPSVDAVTDDPLPGGADDETQMAARQLLQTTFTGWLIGAALDACVIRQLPPVDDGNTPSELPAHTRVGWVNGVDSKPVRFEAAASKPGKRGRVQGIRVKAQRDKPRAVVVSEQDEGVWRDPEPDAHREPDAWLEWAARQEKRVQMWALECIQSNDWDGYAEVIREQNNLRARKHAQEMRVWHRDQTYPRSWQDYKQHGRREAPVNEIIIDNGGRR